MHIKPEYQVPPSKDGWYVVAWKDFDDQFQFGVFVQVRDGVICDEDGEELEGLFDPITQSYCAADGADAYVPQ